MATAEKASVIVVGLGAMGSATCFALASRGASVIGIDQYRPPHRYGSTHGDTRITRLAIGEGAEYVPLVRRSHELWREIEQQAGVTLLTRTGGLILAHPDNEFLRQTRVAARRYGIAHEDLGSTELAQRFEMFAVDSETEAYYEPEAGFVRPEAAVQAQLELARSRGARLRFDEHVRTWTASAGGVTVETDRRTYDARWLVLSAGAWISQLFAEAGDTFAAHRQLLYWFEIREGYEQLREIPVFVWDFGGEKAGFVHFHGIYGFPAIDGPAGGMKLATESYEQTTTPDGRQHPATDREIETMYECYVRAHLPWLGPSALRTSSCLYTSTRDNRFVIDRHPEHGNVLIVSPCSGHGFKHSPAIGEAVAQWVIGDPIDVDLSPFRLSLSAS